jgi:hypothetical protein
MGSIEDFLLARIAEDESDAALLAEPMRSQVSRSLEATRRAVAMRVNALREHESFTTVSDYDGALWDVLTVLALPYAEHPEYLDAFRPDGRAVVEPELNRPLTPHPLDGTVPDSETQQRAYLQVAVALAQAVLVEDPATPEQWVSTSIGIIGLAWSNEMSTELILSRALLAMTHLAIAEANVIARDQAGESTAHATTASVLAAMAERPT